MKETIEAVYQAALLADAAYVRFNNGGYLGASENDPGGTNTIQANAFSGAGSFGGRGWHESRFDEFIARYQVIYHQPDELNGFSATLFFDSKESKYVAAFRGTNGLIDVALADVFLALGFDELDQSGQRSSISTFFENAGLIDSNGQIHPQYAGNVDFVGHSLGGHLSLWATHEFTPLMASVHTFNGAGIAPNFLAPPFLQAASQFLLENALTQNEESRILNLFAEEGIEFTSNDLTFFRPGERQGLFIERETPVITAGFHSQSLLVNSLAVHSLFALLDEDIELEEVSNALYAMSWPSVGTLDKTVEALSDLMGAGYSFSTLEDVEGFRAALADDLGEADSLEMQIQLLHGQGSRALAILASEVSDIGRGYRYALEHFLSFAPTANFSGTALDSAQYDAGKLSNRYLTDRAVMLEQLLNIHAEDRGLFHGTLAWHGHFSDLEKQVFFNSDPISYGDDTISDLRERIVFGTNGADFSSILASSQDDRLYGRGGSDLLVGLAGDDLLEGGEGGDVLVGGEGADTLVGGEGNDTLIGSAGADRLDGGSGDDVFIWNDGHGEDVIVDPDSGGDRIVVNGTDLATLSFQRFSESSDFYYDPSHPGITLITNGIQLLVRLGNGQSFGEIDVQYYQPVSGSNFGIVLQAYAQPELLPADVVVSEIGLGSSEVEPSAWGREISGQGGIDWSQSSIRLIGDAVPSLSGGTLHGTLFGSFYGGPIDDHLAGHAGQNALYGLSGDDFIAGADGDDLLIGGPGSDQIFGGEGNDLLFGSAQPGDFDSLSGGGPESIFLLDHLFDLPEHSNILDGGAGIDYISGGEYTDNIAGGAGNDRLFGGTGLDSISGGDGADIVYGDSEFEHRLILQAPGSTVIIEEYLIDWAGGAEAVQIFDDDLFGGGGDDILYGELGNDRLHGDEGNDWLYGDRESITGGWGAYGETSSALVASLHGDDELFGGAGNDVLYGNAGDDMLSGGSGVDYLFGGAGADVYHYAAGDHVDAIIDSDGTHTLLFAGYSTDELSIVFQGDWVRVGVKGQDNGLHLARSEWPNIRIALDAAQNLVERSALDTFYLNTAGETILYVEGVDGITEQQRDEWITIDESDSENPRIFLNQGVNDLDIEIAESGTARLKLGANLLLSSITLALELPYEDLDEIDVFAGTVVTFFNPGGTIFGTGGNDHIRTDNGDDEVYGQTGHDLLETRGGDDELFGGGGDDVLRGGDGDDELNGDSGVDWLEGGQGNDILRGGHGNDTYYFAPGDGQDVLVDQQGAIHFQFGPGVIAQNVSLEFTGVDDTQFQLNYAGNAGHVTSYGGASANAITSVSLNGEGLPLLQQSSLLHGSLFDTRWHDVFNGGLGNDTIYARGQGDDIYLFASNDGADSIVLDYALTAPEYFGDILFSSTPAVGELSFSFSEHSGAATIWHGNGSTIFLSPIDGGSATDNALLRFTLSSADDSGWLPTIEATPGYLGPLFGTYGTDHIIGGDDADTILPGYGDDLVTAGGGDDTIVLNQFYMDRGHGGIGQKHIFGQQGNDHINAPLAQGLTFHYNLGDGHDTIEYDWSYSAFAPYHLQYDIGEQGIAFVAHGQDTISFGAGISISDLRFRKLFNTLEISLLNGDGSLSIENFFPDLDLSNEPPVNIADFFGEGPLPQNLHGLYTLGVMPDNPITTLRLSDNSEYELSVVLDALLEVIDDSPGLILGTPDADVLAGDVDQDNHIVAFEGDDQITDLGGVNIIDAGDGDDGIIANGQNNIDAGSGSDFIQVMGGQSIVDAGAGDDYVAILAGDHVIQFGYGSGADTVTYVADTASLSLELSEGVLPEDLIVSFVEDEPLSFLHQTDQGSQILNFSGFVRLSLVGSGDYITVLPVKYDAVFGGILPTVDSSFSEVRFADGTVLSQEELLTDIEDLRQVVIAGTTGDDYIAGTNDDDVIVGGTGNDILLGRDGDDTFVIEGAGQGDDHIDGGAGYDSLVGGAGWDDFSLTSLMPTDGLEEIDGKGGILNFVTGTAADDSLDFSATQLINILAILGEEGDDSIVGSQGADLILGGKGDDTLEGGLGNDIFIFSLDDGRDTIAKPGLLDSSTDTLLLTDIAPDSLWFSRSGDDLLLDVVGTDDQVNFEGWYTGASAQFGAFSTADAALQANQVDQLVNAMATYNVPQGVGAVIPEATRLDLEPVLAATWQTAA